MPDNQIFLSHLLLILGLSGFFYGYISIFFYSLQNISQSRLENIQVTSPRALDKLEPWLDQPEDSWLTLKGLKVVLLLVMTWAGLPLFTGWTFLIFIGIMLVVELTANVLALTNPEKNSLSMVGFVSLFRSIIWPFSFVLKGIRLLLTTLFKPQVELNLTQEDLLNMIDEAQNEGGLQEVEGDLLRRSIEFYELKVQDILTPRVNIDAVDIDDDLDHILDQIKESGYSRYPVYRDSIDTVVGLVHTKDLRDINNKADFLDMMKPAIYVPESQAIFNLLKTFQTTKNHMAIVIDEYGGTAGLVTMEDIIEELVGDIYDEHDVIEHDLYFINDHQIMADGQVELDRLEELLELDLEDSHSDTNTIGGWILDHTAKVPHSGDHFVIDRLDVTILDANEKRILKVMIGKEPIKEEEKDENTPHE